MTNVDYLDAGEGLEEQKLEIAGFRRVQHFNESPYHRGTAIAAGGYGIKDEDMSAPAIGKTETVKHRGGNSTIMRTAKEIQIALIGFTQQYICLEATDAEGKYRSVIVPEWISNLPAGAKLRKGISLFVVLKADPAQELYELAFRGFIVNEARQIVASITKSCTSLGAQYTAERGKATKFHPFAFWLTLGVGESRMVGSGDAQSPVTPPALRSKLDRATLESLMVTKDEYIKFIDLRRQVDEYLATGRYNGQYNADGNVALPPGITLPQIAAPAVTEDVQPF